MSTDDFKPIPLTASQIKHFDELFYDKQAAKMTFSIAQTNHNNTYAKILKEENALWEELILAHKLDIKQVYGLDKHEGAFCIVLRKDESFK